VLFHYVAGAAAASIWPRISLVREG
jgi:hypothetical protein